MKIHRLTINNYEDMVKLWTKANLPHKPNVRDSRDSREAMAAQMKANPDFFLGAFEDNQLIGTAIASTDHRKGWINR
jgi:hypothetical protein